MADSTASPVPGRPWLRVNHPLFVAAILLLVVNDRLLEEEWPGVWTGKLSDAAGLFLLGAVGFDLLDRLGASRRWRSAGVAGIAAPFVAAKTIPSATVASREAGGSILDVVGAALGWLPMIPPDGSRAEVVTDPTDLLVLPFLLVPLLLVRARPNGRRDAVIDVPGRAVTDEIGAR